MKKSIATEAAPAAVGPYSQAYQVNETLYVSGQIPFDPKTMQLISHDIEEQTLQVLKNIEAIVKEAGFKVTDIVKCQIFLTNMDNFNKINTVYADFFNGHKPARIAVEVSRLPKDVGIEIDAICVKD